MRIPNASKAAVDQESTLRRLLLILMAVITSFALTACSGYVLYILSEGRSERHLSLMVRFIFNPVEALLVGGLVGLLSKDYLAWTSVVGLVTLGSNAAARLGNWSNSPYRDRPNRCLSSAGGWFGCIGRAFSFRWQKSKYDRATDTLLSAWLLLSRVGNQNPQPPAKNTGRLGHPLLLGSRRRNESNRARIKKVTSGRKAPKLVKIVSR
jgi:hypothetical protein